MTGTTDPKPEAFHLNKARTLSTTEQIWCRVLSSGTATSAVVLQIAKPPSQIALLHQVLTKLKQSHPILRYKLHYNKTTKEFSFLNSGGGNAAAVEFHDVAATAALLRRLSTKQNSHLSQCQLILEHELNNATWCDPKSFPEDGVDVVFAAAYALSETGGLVVLRLHVSVCDRPTGEALLLELMELVVEAEGGRKMAGIKNDGEGEVAVEGLVPNGLGKKTIWAHGMDMLGYSMNSLRLTNLKFKSTKRPRYSEAVRLEMNTQETAGVLAGCKSRGIKLCGALAAAALLAAHSTRFESDKLAKKKYGVVTLLDSRTLLQPPLSKHHFGFYQLALLNSHTIDGTETLWDLAEKTYKEFARGKNSSKHFTDLSDINFLMAKAIENPALTASSSQRTSVISVFEDPVIDEYKPIKKEIGVEDYFGCSSAHGVGPSIALFDTIRSGELECTCVYPAPLHSREQVTELVQHMKRILIDGSY